MKKYKIAKKATIKYEKVVKYIPTFHCPFCLTHFRGYNIDENVTRFLCSQCGNEIIAEHDKS